MGITFYCEQCYQRVQTPDASAGRKGKCPFCGEVIRIPEQSQAAAASADETRQIQLHDLLEELPASPAASLGGRGSARDLSWRSGVSEGGWGSDQPRSRLQQQQAAREAARRTLAAPALSLIVCASVAFLLTAAHAVWVAISAAQLIAEEQLDPTALALHLGGLLLSVTAETLIIVGANHMRMTRSYPLAITASLLAMLPYQLPCFLSAPLGIWSFILLVRPEVRDTFRRL